MRRVGRGSAGDEQGCGTSLPGGSGGGTEFTPEEEQAVLERLKALGYVD